MAADPPLVTGLGGALLPAPYMGEAITLSRDGVELKLDAPPHLGGRWSARGTAFLTNMRIVFVAAKPGPAGPQAYELPLAYVPSYKFSQPILGANSLSGRCRAVQPAGPGQEQQLSWTLYFKNGGVGVFVPIFVRTVDYIRRMLPGSGGGPASEAGPAAEPLQQQQPAPLPTPAQLQTAYVDPSDPTKIYLTQPVEDSQRLPEPPKFAALPKV